MDGDIDQKERPESITYTFNDESFLKDFQTLRMPYEPSVFSTSKRQGYLAIRGLESMQSNHRQAMVVRRQEDFSFEAVTELEFDSESFQQMAGLMYRYDETNHYYLYASYDEELMQKELRIFKMDNGEVSWLCEPVVYEGERLFLKVDVNYCDGQFYYSLDGDTYEKIGGVFDVTILSDEHTQPEGFTGAFIGMACQDLVSQEKSAYFKSFTYKRK